MFYITTPIPYTNASPHLGHLLEGVFNDTIARFYRRVHPHTVLCMGLDQHGLKIYQKAQEAGQEPAVFVRQQGQTFKTLWQEFDVNYDRFIETSTPGHAFVSRLAWKKLEAKGLIYKKSYEGLYCVGDESFVTERDLVDGCCPNHPGQKPIVMKEENYFFRLSGLTGEVEKFLRKTPIQPEYVKKEFLNFVAEGLQDISISRENSKLPWGVPVPGDESQVMYVWFEALLNYLTGAVEPTTLNNVTQSTEPSANLENVVWRQIQENLPIDLMYLGKDIARFHLVIWIGMLSALELELPQRALVHGFINDSEGRKFSKSLGNGVMPGELVERFGVDGSRFILLHEVNVDGDTNFDWSQITEAYNAHLANNLGNLLMRVTNLVEKFLHGVVDLESVETPFDFSQAYVELDNLRTREALDAVLAGAGWGNELLEKTKPWELAKQDKMEEVSEVLTQLCRLILDLAEVLSIFLPSTAQEIRQIISAETIVKARPLFARVELESE
jgi:methionyl-tRNA synthetase